MVQSNDNHVKVIVHRGTKNIGGCCTEVEYKNTRLAIDFGSPLPEEKTSKLDISGLTNGKSEFDAVLFTHYHGDHVGEAGKINADIPIYMSGFAKDIIAAYKKHNWHCFAEIDPNMVTELKAGKEIEIGALRVLPILSDHSAAESLMFLIKAGNFQILHTGDFRLHGRYREELLDSVKKLGKIDLLITEGTTLSRKEEEKDNYTEERVEAEIKRCLYENDYCFIILSSTNFDRLQGIKNSVNAYRHDKKTKGKYFLIDNFQQSLFEIADKRLPERYKFGKEVSYRSGLDEKMKDRGFIMLIRMGKKQEDIFRKYMKECPERSCLIYSMWSGYMKTGKLKELTDIAHDRNRLRIIHSSGHVTVQDLKDFVDVLAPEHVIVIHTKDTEKFDCLKKQIPIKDGEALEFQTC
ncbi:MBL fold metallo-hydrolase [Butyrivibrio sp. NC2002]|uniref:MBL fold metallo-hydrolase n=1 Tax=Butyrivibrio sp. NC2002 TaxID=1410610 RepID=UPI0005633D1C|nr:MBL fold metallo-hydrolase [Butyrivibrio sp. NC2002]